MGAGLDAEGDGVFLFDYEFEASEFFEGLAASGGLDEAFEFFVRIGGSHNCLAPCCVRFRGFRPRGGVMAGGFSGAARGKRDGAAPCLAGWFRILAGG